MTTLILIPSLNDFALDYFIEEYNRNDCIVIALDPNAHRKAKDAGLPSQFISSALEQDDASKDRDFAALCLPGVFSDTKFLGTDLDVADVLSIDRLSFWYGGANTENVMDIISALNWDRLVTVLDLYHPAPLYFMNKAQDSVAVCYDWSKELSDICSHLTFDVVIATEENKQFLEKRGFSGTIETRKEKAVGQIDFQRRVGLRSGLGIDSSERVIGVIYEKEYDWQARYVLEHTPELKRASLVFFAEDDRSRELLPKAIPGAVLYDLNMAPICDQFIAFGYKPYLKKYGDKVQIVDPHGLNEL